MKGNWHELKIKLPMIQHHFNSPQLVEFWIFQNEQWLTLSNALDLILEKEKINSGRTFVLNGSANDQQDQSQSCNIWSCFLLSILATHQKSDVTFFFLCCNLLKNRFYRITLAHSITLCFEDYIDQSTICFCVFIITLISTV